MNTKTITDLPEELLSKIATYILDITTYDAYRVSCKKIRQSLIGGHYNGVHYETIDSIGSKIPDFIYTSYNIYAEPKGRTRTIASDNGDSLADELFIDRDGQTYTLTVDISNMPYVKHLGLRNHNIYRLNLGRNLYTLDLFGCRFITRLPDLGKIKILDISSSNITDVSMCGNLHMLLADSTDVSDVSMLGNIHTLNISHTKVTDVSALGKIHILFITGARVTDVSMLNGLESIHAHSMYDLDVSMLTNVKVYI
jgi:Leucine-rich repeat (LRR) protein